MEFVTDGKTREVLYLAAAVPRPSSPAWISGARLRSAEAYAACPILALPCLSPLAFLASEPPGRLLVDAASALSGGLSVTGISARGGIAFAELGPRQRWLAARDSFASASLDSPYSAEPGICLGPADRAVMEKSLAEPLAMSLSVQLFALRSPEGRWEEGITWEILSSIRSGKAAASQPPERVI